MAQIWPGLKGPGVRFITAPPSSEWQKRKRRHVVVLGSTGSIGRNTLSVIESHPDSFSVWPALPVLNAFLPRPCVTGRGTWPCLTMRLPRS